MKSILVIDDIQTNRELLESLLGNKYRVYLAETGQEGLDKTRLHKPDLVICDILMPEVDGFEFVRQVRIDPLIADLQIIFYSAHFTDQEAVALARDAGVANLIAKPCPPDVLLSKVNALMETGSGSGTPPGLEYQKDHLKLITNKLAEKTEALFANNQRLANLIELNLHLASKQDVSELLSVVCHGARMLVRASTALLVVREKCNGQVAHTMTSGFDLDNKPVDINDGIFSVIYQKKTVERQHYQNAVAATEPGLPESHPSYTSLIVVPVVSLTESYGWLCLTRSEQGMEGFSDEDELLLTILAAQTGRIYQNGSLYLNIKHHAVKLEQEVFLRNRAQLLLSTQYQTARILALAPNITDALPRLLEVVCERLDFAAGRVWEFNQEEDHFYTLADWMKDPAKRQEFHNHTLDLEKSRQSDMLGDLMKFRQPIWVEDVTRDEEIGRLSPDMQKLVSQFNLIGMLVMPLKINDELIGIMILRTDKVLLENEELKNVISTIAAQISHFIERRRQLDSIENLNRLYAVLSGINHAIVHVHDLDKLFQIVCDTFISQGNFRIAWLGILNSNEDQPDPVYWQTDPEIQEYGDALLSLIRTPDEEIIFKKVLKSRTPAIMNRLRTSTDEKQSFPVTGFALEKGCRSAAAIPLKLPLEPNAVLVLYASETDVFDDEEMHLLEELAGDLSFAVKFISNEKQLNVLAYWDSVTNLRNRSSLLTILNQIISEHGKNDGFIALAALCINNFGDINDVLGHSNGDLLLSKVAHSLQELLLEPDIVASIGGNQFGVLLCNVRDIQQIRKRIENVVGALSRIYYLDGIPVNIELSAGITVYPQHSRNPDTLLQNAGIAMRQARGHHNPVLFYGPDIDFYKPQQLALVGEIRRAIDHDELCLHLQPQIELKTGKLAGVEALVRWEHPVRGLIYPDNFIPFLEQTDLINHLTMWVIRESAACVERLQSSGFMLEFSLNLSVRNLMSQKFTSKVLEFISTTTVSPRQLTFEITETAMMSDPHVALQNLRTLHEAGLQIALDDFGIGHSSLAYLKDLPVGKLKIDKSFIMNIEDEKNMAIVRSAIDLSHNMGLKVVAEGVEDSRTELLLARYGCDLGQGYHFSKALPETGFLIWAENRSKP